MADFKGNKQGGASRCDRVILVSEVGGLVSVYAFDGYLREGHNADVSPATARAIAAALIKAADEAEAGQ